MLVFRAGWGFWERGGEKERTTYIKPDDGNKPSRSHKVSAGPTQHKHAHLQPDINLRQRLPKPVRPLARRLEMLLGAVQRLKQRDHIPLIRLLSSGKPRLVHAIVDLVVLPLMRRVDLLAEVLWVELDAAVFFVDEVVELLLSVAIATEG